VRVQELIALGGLFHDIGKPVQRAGLYSGDHSTQGAKFLRKLAEETGIGEYELLALFSEFHHISHMKDENRMREAVRQASPGRFGLSEEDVINALWIVYEADNLSSREREEGKGELKNLRPLSSIFNSKLSYPVVELELENAQGLPIPSKDVRVSRDDYRDLVHRIFRELKGVPLRVDRVLPVLERYLTFVSSVTTEGNVISLYDHMRMTSAIALSMFLAGCTAGDVKGGRCKKEKKFLLIEGDFSGIQSFIYGVSGKGTLKYLRARSAYLELIGWDVVFEILRRLHLTRANVLFNAGGHFLVIAPNTPEAVKELEDIRRKVSEWLYGEFEGSIYLALEWEPVTGKELGRECLKWDKGRKECLESVNHFENARKRLKRKLTTRKLRRFEGVKNLFGGPKTGERLEECAVCGKEVPPSELEQFRLSDDPNVRVCRTCNELARLGSLLPKVKGFILDRNAREGEAVTDGPFRHFIPYMEGTASTGEALLLKNTLKPPEKLPLEVEFIPYPVADYFKYGKEGVATFEELAEASTGTKRLGVIKGDVDRLGDFFRGMDSPSKLATASRFMDYFFKVYLNEIIHGKFGDLAGEPMLITRWPDKPAIVVVYAGGDDFFIVGAWDQAFELAFRIRDIFTAYTGGSLTVSMGLGYFDYRTPVYRIADVVGGRLDLAKDEGRNRVTVIERTRPGDGRHLVSYGWEQYGGLWRRYGKKVYAGNGKLRKPFDSKKGLLMRLLELRELYVRNPEDFKWAYLTAYLLGRHGLSETFPELVGIDVRALERGEPQPIYWIDGVLKIVLMAVRG